MTSLAPRVVLVSRQTEYDRLLAAHATRGQAAFFLESRGQNLARLEESHERQIAAINEARRATPSEWSITNVLREDLDRFLFTADDIVVAIGQDGLVANLAKYLSGQPVIGITPEPDRTEGVLTPLSVGSLPGLLPRVAAEDAQFQRRAMVEAHLNDGQSLAALNELFIGHRSHQSARYVIQFKDANEAQSSSGIIVSTGTGLSGWARSILTATHRQADFGPEDRRAIFFAREPWPSRVTGCKLSFGEIGEDDDISLTSKMNDGGVIFADGIEQDYLRFNWGIEVKIMVSARTLNLVAAD